MVTPIQPGSFPQQSDPAQTRNSKIVRQIAEAKRLVNENKITGAKAMRVQRMIEDAEQNASSGRIVTAEQIARKALSFTRETVDSSTITGQTTGSSEGEKSEETSVLPNAEEESDSTDANLLPGRETSNYADDSSDEGVSFQFEQPLTQAQAPFAVRQHELSHVRRDTSDAILNGQRVMTSVRIFSRIDPRTGERHVDGGNARIIIFPNIEPQNNINRSDNIGNKIDKKA